MKTKKKSCDKHESGTKSITDMVMDYEDSPDSSSGDSEEKAEGRKDKKMAKDARPTPSKDSKAFMKGRYKSILKKK